MRHVLTTLIVLVGSTIAQADQFVRPTIGAVYSGEPRFDYAAIMDHFVGEAGTVARKATRLHIGWNEALLYINCSANENDMPTVRLSLSRDPRKRVRDNDSVSYFFRIEGKVYEFTVASDGALDDVLWAEGEEDAAYESGATVTVDRPDEWMASLRMPWSALGIVPRPGMVLDFAARRLARSVNEHSGWPSAEDGNPPTQWAKLSLIKEGEPFVTQFIPSRPDVGPNSLVHWLRPDGTRCRIVALAAGAGQPMPLPLEPRYEGSGGGWWSYAFHIPPGEPLKLQYVMRVHDDVLHATTVIALPLPTLTDQLADTQSRLADLDHPSAVPLRRVANALFDKAAVALDSPAGADRTAALTELSDRADRLARRASILQGRARSGQTGSFAVGTTHATRKLKRAETSLDYDRPLRLRAARRERESGQIVILPGDTPLTGVTVTWTGLAAAHVTIDRVEYVRTSMPNYEVEHVGWWPDPLMPLEPFDVPVHQTQPLWLTCYVPPATPAGVHRGAVTIDAGAAGTFEQPVELEVLDYDLPLRGKLQTIFAFSWSDQLQAWYGWDTPKLFPDAYKTVPRDRARQIWDMTLAHRIYAGELYGYNPYPREENLQYCLDRGMNTYKIGHNGSSQATKDPTEFIPRIRKAVEMAKEHGILDMCFSYAWDEYAETHPHWRDHYLNDFRVAKRTFPDLALCNVYSNPDATESIDALDIVVPNTRSLVHREKWEAWRQRGKVLGAYTCTGNYHPVTSFFIDYPSVEHRVLFWQFFDHHITFYLTWGITQWKHNIPRDPNAPRWPDAPWNTASHGNDNGDGQIVYPGRTAVLASVRLANIRDGIEDYEALAVLAAMTEQLDQGRHADLIARNRAMLAIPDRVTASITQFTTDPEVVMDARRRTDQLILETKDALGRR